MMQILRLIYSHISADASAQRMLAVDLNPGSLIDVVTYRHFFTSPTSYRTLRNCVCQNFIVAQHINNWPLKLVSGGGVLLSSFKGTVHP